MFDSSESLCQKSSILYLHPEALSVNWHSVWSYTLKTLKWCLHVYISILSYVYYLQGPPIWIRWNISDNIFPFSLDNTNFIKLFFQKYHRLSSFYSEIIRLSQFRRLCGTWRSVRIEENSVSVFIAINFDLHMHTQNIFFFVKSFWGTSKHKNVKAR